MSRIVLVYGLLLICGFINAASHSTVTLKNGSVVTGDIVVQRIGKDMTVETENATFLIEPKDIVSKQIRKVKYDDLSREIKRWVLENKALKGDAYGRYAELVDIKTKNYSYTGLVNKRKDGKETDEYIQVTPTIFNIKWRDIQNIDKNFSDEIKYSLTDKVTTFANKTYEGKIVSQKTGNNVTVETSKGRVTIPNNEIMEIRKMRPKESNSPFNDIDYVNVVVLKNGKEKEGFVSTHHYGKKDKDNYVNLLNKNGNNETILISNISEIHTKYDKREISPYAQGKVYINEFKINNARSQRTGNNVVFLDKQVFPFPEGISITFKSDGYRLSGNWMLVALSELPTSGGKNSWGYDIRLKGENTIQQRAQDQTTSVTQITYGYLSPGYYALVNDADTEAYVFKITK